MAKIATLAGDAFRDGPKAKKILERKQLAKKCLNCFYSCHLCGEDQGHCLSPPKSVIDHVHFISAYIRCVF
jgi:5-methylcytosine-specific restriction endonuclease McrA